MENYFDIATPEELEEDYGYKPTPEQIHRDKLIYEENPDSNFQSLFWLFLQRGDSNRADIYYNKIQDPQMKLDAYLMAYECMD